MDNLMQAFSVLVIGFVVVFTVLIMLIGVINLYSGIVRMLFNKNKKDKDTKVIENNEVKASTDFTVDDGSVPEEVIAVIAAAVSTLYGDNGKCRIRSIKRINESRPAWRTAGILESTRPFTLR